jgi:hypothetical protein
LEWPEERHSIVKPVVSCHVKVTSPCYRQGAIKYRMLVQKGQRQTSLMLMDNHLK